MNLEQITHTMDECHRFLKVADKARIRIHKDCEETNKRIDAKFNVLTYNTISKETAACRRASLDLTRALAEMRK